MEGESLPLKKTQMAKTFPWDFVLSRLNKDQEKSFKILSGTVRMLGNFSFVCMSILTTLMRFDVSISI